MGEIRISGASDDLVEISGAIYDEVNHYGSEPWEAVLRAPNGEQMRVHAAYTSDGMWMVGASQVERDNSGDGHPIVWPIFIRQGTDREECEYTAVLVIDAPDGTVLEEQ